MDAIFKALNDPARRTLLDSLRDKDGQTLQELEAQLDMSRFGVMKHLKVLQEAGLVVPRRKGRFKHHYLNAVPLQQVIDRWIEPLLAKPAARALLALKANLEGTTNMTETLAKPDFVLETFIRCTQDALWQALTDADSMAAYHFACSAARGDAGDGSTTEFLRQDGSVMLRQRTTAIDPKTRIEMTFEPNWTDRPSPASRVAFHVAPEGEACKLTIEHFELPDGQDGIREGWARWAASLKSWLETGQPIKSG